MGFSSQSEDRIEVRTERFGEATVIRLAGYVNELGADALSSELDKVLEAGNHKIIFDLSDVLFLSSTGLGQIMRGFRTVKDQGGYVRIANPQPLIADLFRLTKLDRLLRIYPSVEKAAAAEQ